jgi:hypothetical protein
MQSDVSEVNWVNRGKGRLRNGNPPGDPRTAPRCLAKTRHGTPCQCPAMPNGRCRMHGGCSTGPRTPEGKRRSKVANYKHGRYLAQKIAYRKQMSALMRALRAGLGRLDALRRAGRF